MKHSILWKIALSVALPDCQTGRAFLTRSKVCFLILVPNLLCFSSCTYDFSLKDELSGVDSGADSYADSNTETTVPTDLCPQDTLKTEPGICGCGIPEIDSDNDGTPDCIDKCSNDPQKIAAGQCGCSTPDIDSDLDGTLDCEDSCPSDPAKIAPGQCGCGVADIDSDNDSTPDCKDDCPNDSAKIAPGQCSCGMADIDSDNDGTPDCKDGCETDPNKTEPGECGCTKPEVNGCTIGQNIVLNPVADSYVSSTSPTANFGSALTLRADTSPEFFKTLIKFTVPELSAKVQNAMLRLYVTDTTSNGPELFLTSDPWTESTVNSNNCPAATGTIITDLGSFGMGWLEIEVTSAMTSSGDYTFLLIPDSTEGAQFESREAVNKPQLIVVTSP